MFCNKCGKTLNPEVKTCPSCGQPVGDSRFDGSGYTSSQVRFVPDGAEQQGYAPYTKTTYSSTPDEGGDVYSRTSYRPALAKDEGGQTTGFADAQPEAEPEEQPETGASEDGQPEDAVDDRQREQPETYAHQPYAHAPESAPRQAEPDDRDALGIEIKPLEPIRKTGISPEVQRYIQQMNQKKDRAQHKSHAAHEDAEHLEGEPQESEAAQQHEEDEDGAPAPRAGSGIGKWALRVGAVVAVVALVVVGILFIADRTANRAKIPNVTYTLYTEGISLIKTHATDEYRTGIIKLWRADQTGKAASQQQDTETQQISVLLPETPLENDQLFVDTLLAIQKSIVDATAVDAIAALSAGSTALGSLSDESQRNWEHINAKIGELEAAADVAQLTAVKDGVALTAIATPVPEPTETPSPYKTLKKGMKNNKQVKNLQDRLYKLGWFNGVRDGDFGPATQSAVKKFQKAIGLPVEQQDGIATSQVQERLYADDAPRGDGKVSDATAAPEANEPTPAPEGGETPNA